MESLKNTAFPVLSDVLVQDQPMLSREAVTVLAGDGAERQLKIGTVIGKISLGDITLANPAAIDTNSAGNGTFGAITGDAGMKAGDWVLEFNDATHFVVHDPDGVEVGHGVAGTAYDGEGPNFTFTAGGTPQVAGDLFSINVSYADGSGKVVALDPAAVDGSQNAWGVMISNTTALDGEDADGVAVRRAAVLVAAGLIWPAGITDDQKAAAIAKMDANQIVLR